VLCDGLGCEGFAWKYLLPVLKASHRVVHWHYRGHGRSTQPTDPARVGMAYICDDLEALLDHLRLPHVVLFGHSMGVQVALEFHRRHAHRILALGLFCGSYGNPLDTLHDDNTIKAFFPAARWTVEHFPKPVSAVLRNLLPTELALQFALTFELNRKLLKRDDLIPYFDHLAQMDPRVFMRTLGSLAEHSAWDHLPHVNVPTLVVGGERDRFTPLWLSRRMAEAIPGATFVTLPGGSHTGPLEQPEATARAAQNLLARLAPLGQATSPSV
jgi:pimeloyl-ACP methyl ester carboxylesterase